MNLVYPACLLGGIAFVVPWFLLWEQHRRHRDQPTRITVTPRERSNVVALHNVAEPGSNVRPLVPNPRRWPA